MQEKAPIFKSSYRLLIIISNSFFYTTKVTYFVFTDSSSPVKASNFNPLNPDLLTLYRRPIPIKIWPTYAVPPLAYDLWRAGSSPTIFQPVEKHIPLSTTSQSGPDQPRCILDQHTLPPIKARLLPIRAFFQSG